MVTSAQAQQANQRALEQAARTLSLVLQAGGFAVRPALEDTGVEVVNEVRRSMASTRRDPSRRYRRGTRVHIASAPGQPPAPDTGRLTSSYGWRLKFEPRRVILEVGTDVDYAPHLEMGTRNMAARPHLRPAINKTALRIGHVIARRMESAQRDAARRGRSAAGSLMRLPGLGA